MSMSVFTVSQCPLSVIVMATVEFVEHATLRVGSTAVALIN